MVAAVLHLHIGAGAILQAIDQMAGGFADRHDVVDPHPRPVGQGGIGAGGRFFGVAQDKVDLGHGGEGRGIDLSGAAGDDHLGAGALAPGLADGLARLAHSLAGHGAGVEDDGVGQAILGGSGADHLGLIGVEPAAKGDDVHVAHGEEGDGALGRTPVNSTATGPVIRTWPSLSRHSMVSSPPSNSTAALRSVRPRR